MPYKDPQKRREYERLRYAADPEKAKKKTRDRRAKNPDVIREQEKLRREVCIEKSREKWRAQYWANPEKKREYSRIYRDRNQEKQIVRRRTKAELETTALMMMENPE